VPKRKACVFFYSPRLTFKLSKESIAPLALPLHMVLEAWRAIRWALPIVPEMAYQFCCTNWKQQVCPTQDAGFLHTLVFVGYLL
jgi:hypothetical protein